MKKKKKKTKKEKKRFQALQNNVDENNANTIYNNIIQAIERQPSCMYRINLGPRRSHHGKTSNKKSL